MKLHFIDDLDTLYPEFERWWLARKVAPAPRAMLPRLGIAVLDDVGAPVAAAWLYMDNSISLAFLNWFVTRPGLPPRQARHALEHLLEFLAREAKALGITHLISSCTQKSLSRLLVRRGFHVAGGNIIHHHQTLA